MMKVERSVRAAIEARTKDGVGDLAVDYKVVHLPPIARVVLEVGVLDYDYVTRYCPEPCSQRASLALIAFMINRTDRNPRGAQGIRERDVPSIIKLKSRATA